MINRNHICGFQMVRKNNPASIISIKVTMKGTTIVVTNLSITIVQVTIADCSFNIIST